MNDHVLFLFRVFAKYASNLAGVLPVVLPGQAIHGPAALRSLCDPPQHGGAVARVRHVKVRSIDVRHTGHRARSGDAKEGGKNGRVAVLQRLRGEVLVQLEESLGEGVLHAEVSIPGVEQSFAPSDERDVVDLLQLRHKLRFVVEDFGELHFAADLEFGQDVAKLVARQQGGGDVVEETFRHDLAALWSSVAIENTKQEP